MKTGTLVSRVKINKTFGKHGTTVLLRAGYIQSAEKRNWFKALKDLPTEEDFQGEQKKAFTEPLESVVDDAFSEIECLAEEMRGWYDNMPESLQGGDKGSTIDDAANSLESIDRVEVPEFLKDVPVFISPGDGDSRSAQANQASYSLQQVAEAVEKYSEEIKATADKTCAGDTERANLLEGAQESSDFAEAIRQSADELESVEFPGMY